jgi:NADH dehydrogenase
MIADEGARMAETQLVALTGATGFVGRHLLLQLLTRGHRVRALVRDPAKLQAEDSRLEPVPGDLADDAALASLVRGCDAVMHLVGIIMEKPAEGQTFERVHVEATRRLLAAAGAAGVSRWIHMSALGARPGAVSRYHRTKWTAEEAVRGTHAAGMAWTIFRPSIIHGPDGEFMRMVKGFWTKRFPPFVPYFGAGLTGSRGAGRLQPVYVEDVATCFADALTNPRATGETYPLGGPEAFTWPELYRVVGSHLPAARSKSIVAVPAWYANLIAGLPGVPFNKDQVIMSQEDSVCGVEKARGDFGIHLAAFEEMVAAYAEKIQ